MAEVKAEHVEKLLDIVLPPFSESKAIAKLIMGDDFLKGANPIKTINAIQRSRKTGKYDEKILEQIENILAIPHSAKPVNGMVLYFLMEKGFILHHQKKLHQSVKCFKEALDMLDSSRVRGPFDSVIDVVSAGCLLRNHLLLEGKIEEAFRYSKILTDEYFNGREKIVANQCRCFLYRAFKAHHTICCYLGRTRDFVTSLMKMLQCIGHKECPECGNYSKTTKFEVIQVISRQFQSIGYIRNSIMLNKKALSMCEKDDERGFLLCHIGLCYSYFTLKDVENVNKYYELVMNNENLKEHPFFVSGVEAVKGYKAVLDDVISGDSEARKLLKKLKPERKKVCNFCEKKEGTKKCSRCRFFFYCSVRCQKADWKSHKLYCVDLMKI